MADSHRQLLFVPSQQDAELDNAVLTNVLSGLGLIGKQINTHWSQRFYIGDRFLLHLNFMGCAPALEFVPSDAGQPNWASFTFLSLYGPWSVARCLIDPLMAKPACPHCSKRHALSEHARLFIDKALTCPHCQTSSAINLWDWREFGGCGRQFFSIVNVYPKEALPTQDLLNQLQEVTQFEWRYFYVHAGLMDEDD